MKKKSLSTQDELRPKGRDLRTSNHEVNIKLALPTTMEGILGPPGKCHSHR